MDSSVLPVINELDRKAISLLRILAIFSVITAHVNNVSMVNGTIGWIVACFWDAFGQVGVVCFFILGGFLYHREVDDGKKFAKKKFISIIIPWLLSACLTYALSCILNHHIDFIGALKWIMGFGTWYYYVTVFLVFLFLFKAIWRRDGILYACMVLTICSIAIYNLIPSILYQIPLTPYLNIFNWIGFFALGVIIRKKNLHTRFSKVGALVFALIVSVFSLVLMFISDRFGYFYLLSIFWELSAAMILWFTARYLAERKWTGAFVPVGNDTYCIYLFHMQIVQFFTGLLPDGIVFAITKPFWGTALMLIIVSFAKKIVCLLPFGSIVCRAIGLKVPPNYKKE